VVKVIDAHAHLEEIDNLEEVLKRAQAAGVIAVVAVGSDYSSNIQVLEIWEKYKNYVYPALGLHPWELDENYSKVLEQIRSEADKIVAIGEVGLDFKIKTSKELQIKAFREVAKLAIELDKPLIIHARDAWRKAFEVIVEEGVQKAVFHWYSGPLDLLTEIEKKGYYISVTPAIEYQRKHIAAVEKFPLDRILVESDSPVNYRGKIAEPADTLISLKGLAKVKNISIEEVAEKVLDNTIKFYSLKI